jgi:predicted anti-sigma-YlaC factor YlaD
MNATALSCREMVELVTDYLEGALPAVEHARFDAHIGACDGCTAYLEQMRTTVRLTGRLTEEEIPAESLETLLRAFRGWRSG